MTALCLTATASLRTNPPPFSRLDALGGEVTVLLQLLLALALLLAWNPLNDACCLRYALGGVIRAQ